MTANRYYADAWGGAQVDEYMAAKVGGSAPKSALCPSTAHLTQSQWDDTEIPDQQFCMSTSSKTNMQCRAYKVKNEEHCTFHLKRIKRESSDGAEP